MKIFKRTRIISILLTMMLITLIASPVTVSAETKVNLGTTLETYAVLAYSTVTSTGATTIGGDVGGNVGLSAGTSVTGFPPATISNGSIHLSDTSAMLAQDELTTAYNDAAGRTVTANLTGQDLGGMTLTTGVYKFDSSAQLTGTLTLDAQGDPDAAFIFQIGSTLTTASASSINLINGARFCRVFWQVTSSATIGTTSNFVGHIFAMVSITVNTGARVQGQLLARTGAVTLDSNEITNGFCADTAQTTAVTTTAVTTSDTTTTPSGTLDIPDTGETSEPGNFIIIGLLLLGLAVSLAYVRRRQINH